MPPRIDAIGSVAPSASPLRAPDGRHAIPLKVGTALRHIFQSLDRAGVPYCLLRPYDQPPPSGSDIDFVVPAEFLPARLASILQACAAHWRGHVLAALDHGAAWAFVLSGRDLDGSSYYLRLDAAPAVSVRGFRLYGAADLLQVRRRHRGLWVPPPATAFACSLARAIAKKRLDARAADALRALHAADPQGCDREIRRFWRPRQADTLATAARSGSWEEVRRGLRPLRAALLRGVMRRHVAATAVAIGAWNLGRARHLLAPRRGVHVVLLGPDGAGKSTVIEGLRQRLAGVFAGVAVLTVAPSLSQLRDGTYRTRATAHADARAACPQAFPRHSAPVSLLKAAYWLAYYVGGYHLMVRPALARGRLVLHHRYLVDALIDPKRYRYGGPLWALRLLWAVAPKPDLTILLDAPPEVIRARKPELDLGELCRQRAAFLSLVRRTANGHVVDAAAPVETTIAEVADIVVRFMTERTARQLRADVGT